MHPKLLHLPQLSEDKTSKSSLRMHCAPSPSFECVCGGGRGWTRTDGQRLVARGPHGSQRRPARFPPPARCQQPLGHDPPQPQSGSPVCPQRVRRHLRASAAGCLPPATPAACGRRGPGSGRHGAVTFPRQMWQVMGSVRDSVTLGPCCAIAAPPARKSRKSEREAARRRPRYGKPARPSAARRWGGGVERSARAFEALPWGAGGSNGKPQRRPNGCPHGAPRLLEAVPRGRAGPRRSSLCHVEEVAWVR